MQRGNVILLFRRIKELEALSLSEHAGRCRKYDLKKEEALFLGHQIYSMRRMAHPYPGVVPASAPPFSYWLAGKAVR